MKKLQLNIFYFFQFIKKLYFFRQVALIKQQHNFLNFFIGIILFFLLLKSSFVLIFYLLCWNIFPFTQYFLFYNPINYELYLRILCLCILFYSYIIIKRFPVQFKIYSWIFQQINIYQLFVKNQYMNYRLYVTIIVYYIFFLILLYYKNHLALYLFWISLFLGEIFIFVKIKYSFNNLYIIKKLQKYYDLKNIYLQDILKTTIFVSEENSNFYNTYTINPIQDGSNTTLARTNEETMLDTEEINEDEFEEFFLDYNIVPLDLNDLQEENPDKLVLINWFWIKFWFIQLLILSIVNIIICFIILTWGVPENWILDIQIFQYEDKILLEEYQNRTNLLLNNNNWGSTWRWYFTGIFGTGSLLHLFNSRIFFSDEKKQYYKYTKYISYRNAKHSRKAFIYDQLFFFYNYINQILTFIKNSRSTPIPFRETFLYKYFFYEDLLKYNQFKTLLENDSNMLFNWAQKIDIITWLFQKTKMWVKNYYYTAPAIQTFPDFYYKWLDLYRLNFVLDELWDSNSLVQKVFWFINKKWQNTESSSFFLEELFFNQFSPERYFNNYDLRNIDQGVFSHILPKTRYDQNKYQKFFKVLDDNDDYSAEVDENTVSYYYYYPKFRKLMQLYYNKIFGKAQMFLEVEYNSSIKRNKKKLFANYALNFQKYRLKPSLETFFTADSEASLIEKSYDNIFNIYGYHDIIRDYVKIKKSDLTGLEYFFLYDEYKKFFKNWYNNNDHHNPNFYFDELQSFKNLLIQLIVGKEFFPIKKNENGDPSYPLNFTKINKYEYSTLEDLDDSMLTGEDIDDILTNDLTNFSSIDFSQSEKNAINNFYNQTNSDILSELYYENNTNSLQNANLSKYLLRSDFQKTGVRKREFIFQDLLQLYTYSASHFIELKKDRVLQSSYNLNKKFPKFSSAYSYLPDYKDDFEVYSDQVLFNKKDFLQTFGYYYKEADFLKIQETPSIWTEDWLENYYINQKNTYFDGVLGKIFNIFFTDSSKKYWSVSDSLGTQNDLEIYVKNLLWYKYYYKVDAILNYFDYMPSYRNFYMETWPSEYLDYNYYSCSNSLSKVSDVSKFTDLIYTDYDIVENLLNYVSC